MSGKKYNNSMVENFLLWRKWDLGVAIFLTIVATCTVKISNATAQVAPDNSLGAESSVVKPNVEINGTLSDRIDGGAVRGSNLFHSFQELNVGEGRGAYFTNPEGIQNILSRVTGSNPSNIFGKLGVLGDANLFVINPNGIIFGANASLDVRGSFIGTTASGVKFADGAEFNANPAQSTSLLTISVPLGLQFGSNPGAIRVQGSGQGVRTTAQPIDTSFGLRVPSERTLALLGGSLSLEGATLKTAGGRIELGSVALPGFIGLTSTNKGFVVGYEGIQNFQDIKLSQQAVVDASGNGGGDVQLRGRNIRIADGSVVDSSSLGEKESGNLSVDASNLIEITGRSPANDDLFSSIQSFVYPGAVGNGSNITVKSFQLVIRDGGQILSETQGQGTAGSLSVKVRDSIELAGVNRNASGLYNISTSQAFGAGGKLTIETPKLTLFDGAQIYAGTEGQGAAGSLSVEAGEIELAGTATTPGGRESGSSLSTTVLPGATGLGGDLTVKTQRLVARDGGTVSSATLGTGRAGNVTIEAMESIDLVGTSANKQVASSLSARTRGTANAGSLNIRTRRLSVREGAQISARGDGIGNAGVLEIDANSINLNNRGTISAATISGEGGNIFLNSHSLLQLSNNSTITATAGGTGNGGNITINTDTLAALENSDITANAFQGNGGNITINTQGIFRSPDSDITASSRLGINGTVQINTPDVDPSRGLVNIPEIVADVTGLLAPSCPGLPHGIGKPGGEFYITGTGGIPPGPSELVSTDGGWEDSPASFPMDNSIGAAKQQPHATATEIVEAQGWLQKHDGTIVLTKEPMRVAQERSSSLSTPECTSFQPTQH